MLKMFLAPVLGGLIGYITNDLAIRMLFRPRRAICIGKWQLPFTPGLIPRQKARIAASIGAVVNNELLDAATLEQTFLSENVLSAIRGKLDDLFQSLACDETPLRDKLSEYIGTDNVTRYEEQLRTKGAVYLSERLVTADAGGTVIRAAMDSLKERQGLGLLAMFMDDGMTQHLGGRLNRLIEQKGPSLLEDEIGKLEKDWLDRPVCELCAQYSDKAEGLRERLIGLYRQVIQHKLPEALAIINMEQVIVDKINDFSAEELENLIFSIMKKELRAIVYLGALLGFLMGFINLLL